MTAQAHRGDTAAGMTRRSDVGTLRLSQRDIDGLVLCAEHYGAPYDLLAAAFLMTPAAAAQMVKRWRRVGFVTAGRLGPGPGWCWLTKDGMTAVGLRYPATRPPLSRLAHIRAVLAARIWLASGQVWQEGQAWWHSERRLRTGRQRITTGHVPDAEIHWPSIAGRPYAGQVWALEVELSPKGIPRTAAIMAELLSPMRYATVVYLTGPGAHSVVTTVAARLPAGERSRLAVRELPESAFTPERAS